MNLLVTGGSRGIGAAIVDAATAANWSVCASCRQPPPTHGLFFQGDVADPGFAPAFFDFAEQRLGPIDAIVNNAGVTGPLGPFAGVDFDTLRRTLDVNVLGVMLLAREAVRRWQAAARPGNIVNISSIAAATGAPGEYVHYAATKAAVEAFTVGLGKEVAPLGIRVNAVSPGTTRTGIHAAAGDPTRPERVAKRVPLGRVAEPAEIADAVLWLLSPQSAYVTATVLHVAGGL
jgi:hypothetical protein